MIMGSFGIQSSSPFEVQTSTSIRPELNDVDYLINVLCLTSTDAEEKVYNELSAKASALGVMTPSRSTTPTQRDFTSVAALAIPVRSSSPSFSDVTATPMIPSLPLMGVTILPPCPFRRLQRNLTFAQYDKYLAQLDPNLEQPRFLKGGFLEPEQTPSLFSISTRKSYISLRRVVKSSVRWKRRKTGPCAATPISCICCREVFQTDENEQRPHSLPCGHTYCTTCLRIMINRATSDESSMPPRCCTQPIPGQIIKHILNDEEQQLFLRAVLQFSTPWEARIFCPNPNCLEFIPPRKVDPKHPFEVECRLCETRVCIMCKKTSHPFGQDCAFDWELDAVLDLGERSGWRRCYKCRTLVELMDDGCTHMTCRCKAQFCYICGAIWDNSMGCPNYCDGEEELERRRAEEEARNALLEAAKLEQEEAAAAEKAEDKAADARTLDNADCRALATQLNEERDRFEDFVRKTKLLQSARHTRKKLALAERYADLTEKMQDRHAKTVQHMEDRQIVAELDLRATLAQSERSVRIRLKYMEAYCDGLGRHATDRLPQRVVTERDLRELGQQYTLRDGMERLHQARINVMRDRQAKRVEGLLERQEEEMSKLEERRESDVEALAAEFADDEDTLGRVFEARQERLVKRWALAVGVLQAELEKRTGQRFGKVGLPEWEEVGGGLGLVVGNET